MKKTAKIVLRVLLIVLCILLIGVGIVFGLNKYNDHKYGSAESSATDVTDISQYPAELNGIDVEYVDSGTFQGFHLTPDNKEYKGVIVCYGGSEGSPCFDLAQRYAEEGFESLAVFMFGMKNQPERLSKIPLEQFEDVLKYINNNITENDPITVIAASKGAEYALNLATKYDVISNVVLIAPSAYSFSGLSFESMKSSSSWTWEGAEIPYIDIRNVPLSITMKKMVLPMLTGAPFAYKDIYDAALEADPEKDKKLIPAQEVKANILLIVGEDDQMWASYDFAKLIKSLNDNAEIYSYEDAGHSFSGDGLAISSDMKVKLGGTLEGNEKAELESNQVIDNFLKSHHSK